jgi:PAS domain-containing protein
MAFERARSIITIPSSDLAFARHVGLLSERHADSNPAEFERHLRGIYPRVVVRERSLSGESPAWYVYRDGSWRPQSSGPWWNDQGLPRIVISGDGWVVEASRTAADLLGMSIADATSHHFTDFAAPGTVDAATQLFEVVRSGHDLEATVVLRPVSGDLIAVEAHVTRDGDNLVAIFRLAEDVDIEPEPVGEVARPHATYVPATDVAFRAYAARALDRMSEPSPRGLELRLRRLYPHAHVIAEGDEWCVYRDRDESESGTDKWWLDPAVARVRYDSQALILEANDAAQRMFGRPMVGHFWQEFVTPGSTEQVTVMLQILAEVGAAETRFRMPHQDGSLVEFDSYTEVDGDEFSTAFRPVSSR